MEKQRPKSLTEAIKEYVDKGFGSMSKNDFEVYIFNEYLKSPQNANMGDYELSLCLRIPKTKVKRLRYEASLKYQMNESALQELFKDSLQYARIVPNSVRCIEVHIEKESVRQYVDSLLKKDHRFSDGSFSSEILRISADDYEYLVEQIYGSEQVNRVTDQLLSSSEVTKFIESHTKPRLGNILSKISKKISSATNVGLKLTELFNNVINIINFME